MESWSPSSWTQRPHAQHVIYPDTKAQSVVLQTLTELPPLVGIEEIRALKTCLEQVEQKKMFLLQAGECAETFQGSTVNQKLELIEKIAQLLGKSSLRKIVQIGRMAGQFAKARTEATETHAHLTLPSYRGDLINGFEFTQTSRTPNPTRLLDGYHHSQSTLNDIHAYHQSTLFFTSHEALHLAYEQALTRYEDHTEEWFLRSTHFPWIGVRTQDPEGAHIEFIRGISNPIGLKIGPNATPEWLCHVLSRLNPTRQNGRILLITRFGASQVETCLPRLIQRVKEEGYPVAWSCDPMHGNTIRTKKGLKTRPIEAIIEELHATFSLHQIYNSHLGGVHLEMTHEHVTECIGGKQALNEDNLEKAYHSPVDPRLNAEQFLEIATVLSKMLVKQDDTQGSFHEPLRPTRLHAQVEYLV